jgi:hypothetical protein
VRSTRDSKTAVSDQLRSLFEAFDRHDTGTVDIVQFMRAVRHKGIDVSEAKLRTLFNKFDTERCGIIAYSEVIAFIFKTKLPSSETQAQDPTPTAHLASPPATPPPPLAAAPRVAPTAAPPTQEKGEAPSRVPAGYTSTAFLVSLQLIDIIAKQLEESKPKDAPVEAYLAGLSAEYISSALDKCKPALVTEICKGTKAIKEGRSAEGHTLNDKFAAAGTNFEYSYGTMSTFYGGLEGQVGLPNPDIYEAMRAEHMVSDRFSIAYP